MLAPPHLQATTVGEVDPSFCPALALSSSDRTAPDLGMAAALQSSRWMRVTSRGDRFCGWEGKRHVRNSMRGRVERHEKLGLGAVELTTSPSLLSPHIPYLTAFEADPQVIIGLAACANSNHGKLYIQALEA